MEGNQDRRQVQMSGLPPFWAGQAEEYKQAILRIATQLAVDAETITLSDGTITEVYEIDDTGDGVAAGNIAVDVTGNANAGDDCDDVAAAINNNTQLGVVAISDSTNYVTVICPAGVTLTVAETLSGANNAWDAASAYGGDDDTAQLQVAFAERAAIAADVTRTAIDFYFKMDVEYFIGLVYDTNGELIEAITDRFSLASPVNGVSRIRLAFNGATHFAATNVVKVIAFGKPFA